MIKIDNENIVEYIKKHTNLVDEKFEITVEEIDQSVSEDQGDGFINFVYRIKNADKSYILKQAKPYMKKEILGLNIPVERNKLEYETIKLKSAIVNEYIPKINYIDQKNNIFIMEDVSYLKILRFQLCKNIPIYSVAYNCAKFLAKCNFYTSEVYLDTLIFRKISTAFSNSQMRTIMEQAGFISNRIIDEKANVSIKLLSFSKSIINDDKIILEAYKLKDIFMKKSECLVHGDLHTSNIFISEEKLKVIDMEYTFMGPYSYDMGYLIANFISQYASIDYRENINEELRKSFKLYILASIEAIYTYYVKFYNEYWDQDAKEEYKKFKLLRDYNHEVLLKEMCGFAACANMSRILGFVEFPDFDVIESKTLRDKAKIKSLKICKKIILNRNDYINIKQLINDIIEIDKNN